MQEIPVFPRVLRIEPSSLCNLKCRHCPTGTVKMKRGVMNERTFSSIIDNIKANSEYIKVVVMYHGGEPLLNKNFIEMIKRIKGLGIPFIKTVSNGMLLTTDLSQAICESGLNQIEFSLDGTNPEENNFIRRNSDFYKVAENIKNLIKIKEATKIDLDIIISTTQFFTKDLNPNSETNLIPEIPTYLKNEFLEETKNKKVSFKAFYAMTWPKLIVDENIFKQSDENKVDDFYCDHIINTITVRADGNIVPCCYDLTSEIVLGNINEDTLRNIWHNTKYAKFRELFNKANYPRFCTNCINKRYLIWQNP